MFKKLKQFFCRHKFEITNKNILPGYVPGGGILMEVEKTCVKCGKEKNIRDLSTNIKEESDNE